MRIPIQKNKKIFCPKEQRLIDYYACMHCIFYKGMNLKKSFQWIDIDKIKPEDMEIICGYDE